MLEVKMRWKIQQWLQRGQVRGWGGRVMKQEGSSSRKAAAAAGRQREEVKVIKGAAPKRYDETLSDELRLRLRVDGAAAVGGEQLL